ncbi:tRNA (adenosine(37)-N6)-threonylcarbamoyltransferase complex ATPase subunit type 1 TsaE [Rhodoferax sp.]|uniref:tRNA (adenosine(37)-N6)-threonylcarbamoyltransferase complex ATPase subunit type 1 TsaE n=1 Tax=Rhodoferax sp. TaxID=50421 RepID=UPI00283C072A|nr:tRNA (adenosine(37)-N6)-threonylcarbamoyltransferase complex ATPase subunit type 1 TsaE [Rhodoferax sp.]MDR3368560.1 tRNA (adenosine(37)-N6)-threonylcarbamoyltransferase complex ATPase subunit type 1 TsaE [Rhodoferax sp.]
MYSETVHLPIVKTVVWPDEAATRSFASGLAMQPAISNAFIELRGDLGAGKTTLVRHLLRALGVTGRIKSPTYAVVEPYELPGLNVWHFDFYRFSDPREWEEAGFRDIFASPGLKLAEWPEKVAGHLPLADLVVQLATVDDHTRQVTLTAQTPTGVTLMYFFDSMLAFSDKGLKAIELDDTPMNQVTAPNGNSA